VNTPPPSSSTPPPSTTSQTSGGGTGVQAPDGYKTDTDQMSSAGRNITTKAEDAKGEVDEVKPAKVKAAEFGKHEEHQGKHPEYSAAFEQLGAGAVAMCDNLISFAGNLGGAGSSYSEQESANANTVARSGQ
jgi:hypothetical protein